jgi:mevalonate kinase
MASSERPGRGRRRIKRGAGQQLVEGRNFRLADEVRYIQRRASNRDGRVVSFGDLLLFSTDTGDAWLLDRSDGLATRLARDGEVEPVHIEETDTSFVIGWKGRYRITGPAFVYSDRESGRVLTILGYPTDKITAAV